MRRCAKCRGPLGSQDAGTFCDPCYAEFLRSIIGTIPCPICVLGHIDETLCCSGCRRQFMLVEKPVRVPVESGDDS